MCPSGQRGAGSTPWFAWANRVMVIEHNAITAIVLTTSFSTDNLRQLPHWQLLSTGENHVGRLFRPRRIASIFRESAGFDRHLVANFHRVAFPAAADESVWRAHFDLEALYSTALVFRVDKNKRMWIDPVQFRYRPGDRR